MPIQKTKSNSSKRDKLFAAGIHRFVHEFQNIEIRVTPGKEDQLINVVVHPPYMCQSVTLIDNHKQFKQLKERHQVRLLRVKEARETAGEALKTFFDRHFYEEDGREKLIASGRGKLAEIKMLLKTAVVAGVVSISKGNRYPDGYDLRRWLKRYGVGIDCSGFVQQVLERLWELSRLEVGRIPINESKLENYFLRSGWAYENIKGNDNQGDGLFSKVLTPAQARPGDVLVNQSHMRIVAGISVIEDGEIVFDLAESTSSSDIPSGLTNEETDIGPRIIQVKYIKANQPISKQTPLKKRLIDAAFKEDRSESSFIIGRCRELEQS